jgi:ketosteroid isomerase-like protein
MKKNLIFTAIAVMAITACQQTPQPVQVDILSEMNAITVFFDDFYARLLEGEVDTVMTYFTDDVVYCGTDPSEFWNKEDIKELWTQMLADGGPDMKFLGERVTKVADDGNSAVAVEQYIIPAFSPNIPWRNVYHLVKKEGKWKIFFMSSAFIPKNEDISILNEALAGEAEE